MDLTCEYNGIGCCTPHALGEQDLWAHQLLRSRVQITACASKVTGQAVEARRQDDVDLMRGKVWQEDLHQAEGHTLVWGGAQAEAICGKLGTGYGVGLPRVVRTETLMGRSRP